MSRPALVIHTVLQRVFLPSVDVDTLPPAATTEAMTATKHLVCGSGEHLCISRYHF